MAVIVTALDEWGTAISLEEVEARNFVKQCSMYRNPPNKELSAIMSVEQGLKRLSYLSTNF
jgi:hypothetical protein